MVSIIIPVYNGEKFIDQTIDCCINQSYKNVEIIVVNDCSNDNTRELMKKYISITSIVYIANKSNLGFCKSVNRGLLVAKGEYILVLGQDDILPKNHIKIMMRAMKKNSAAVYCNYYLIDENDKIGNFIQNASGDNISVLDLSRECVLHSCGILQQKKFLVSAGGYPEFSKYPNYGEWYLWINMASIGNITFTKDTVSYYRRHSNNLTNNFYDVKGNIKLNEFYLLCKARAIRQCPSFFKKLLLSIKLINDWFYLMVRKCALKLNLYSMIKRILKRRSTVE